MKNVTFQIEFTAKINDDVDPSDVTFDIDLARVTPQVESNGLPLAMSRDTLPPMLLLIPNNANLHCL